jgi:hypothetical protein
MVFNDAERDALGLHGLLPPRVFSAAQRALHIIDNVRRKPNNLEKYLYITGLQNRNESLFYRVLIDNMEELTPIIYTPTVGQGCLEYSMIFSESCGIFITKYDRGCGKKILKNLRIKMFALLWSPTANQSWSWAISVPTAWEFLLTNCRFIPLALVLIRNYVCRLP